jgi:hypothetical protein
MWRRLDVRAVVESPPFTDASAAAGAGGPGRPVSRARMAGTGEQLREVGANEWVVTTTTLLGTGAESARVPASLAAAPAPAISSRR